MFDSIEREYKKGLQEKRFLAYYGPRALVIIAVAIFLDLVVGLERWTVYGCAVLVFIGLVAVFFLREYLHAHKTMETVRQHKTFSNKLTEYFKIDDGRRIDKLVADLAHHHLHTKADLELTLDYFQSRLPMNSKPNLLEWIFTAVITLSSIVIVSYDSSLNTINLQRLMSVFGPTVVVALIILTPFIIAKIIMVSISKSRTRVDTSLVQDLAYIYINFDQYRDRLAAHPQNPQSPRDNILVTKPQKSQPLHHNYPTAKSQNQPQNS